jgi:hypothetical protein
VPGGVFVEERVGAGQVMRHLTLLARHLHRRVARIRLHHGIGRELEAVAADQRLGEVDRVLDHRDVRQHAAVPDEPFGHRGAVAQHGAVAAHPACLEVGGTDHEDVAFPAPGGEALPGVRRIRRRVRPAVHPDVALLLLPLDVGAQPHDLLTGVVHVGRDAQVADAAEAVGGGVRLALVFRQRQQPGVPAVGAQPRRLVDRQARVVADVGSRNPLDLILMEDRRPHPREIDLRERRPADETDRQDDRRTTRCAAHESLRSGG